MTIPKILLVEDEALLRLPLEDALVSRGLDVRYASTVPQGLNLANAEQFDAAILDINLRGASVYPLAQLLTDRGVYCVFSSGYTRETLPPPFAHLRYFQKPYAIELLIDHIVAQVKHGR